MLSKDKVANQLKTVLDPEIKLSIVDLGMVRDVNIEENKISVLIALTVAGCPLSQTIKDDVKNAIKKLDNKVTIEVSTTVMNEQQRKVLLESLQKKQFPNMQKGEAVDGKMPRKAKKIIAIASGKGGVGKSTITALLAIEFKKMGFSVGIADVDITGPSIPRLFGLKERLFASDKGIEPGISDLGIKVVSMNLLMDESKPAVFRGPVISKAVQEIYGNVNWENPDILLLDLPPGTSDAPLTVMQVIPIDGIVLIGNPQELVMMIVNKLNEMARVLMTPVIGLIQNMSYLNCPHCNEKIELYGSHKYPNLLGEIPINPRYARKGDEGKIEEADAKELAQIAKNILEKIEYLNLQKDLVKIGIKPN